MKNLTWSKKMLNNPEKQPDFLLELFAHLQIQSDLFEHPPFFTVQDGVHLRYSIPGGHCKSLFMKDQYQNYFLMVMLGDKRLDVKALASTIGSGRLSFAKPEELLDMLRVTPGSVTPFAVIHDQAQRIQVLLDEDMMALPLLNYHPLRNDMSMTITPTDLRRFLDYCGHQPMDVKV